MGLRGRVTVLSGGRGREVEYCLSEGGGMLYEAFMKGRP